MKHWKRLIWGLTAGVCLIGALLLWRGDQRVIRTLTPQQTAVSWGTEDKPYAMASVFLEESAGIPQSSLGEIRLNVEKALTNGGVGSDTHPWLYSASYQTRNTLTCDSGKSEVLLTAVVGDFFRIHPMRVVSGWYMDEDDLMHDRVILDRQAAWDLFASDNVVGLLLELNGVSYQVAAVVELEDGRFNKMAAGAVPRAWVFADSPGLAEPAAPETAADAGETDAVPPASAASSSEPGFTCMEMVLPQPVKDFTASTMKNALKGFISEKTEITDNSGRFSVGSRWQVLKNLTVRGISSGTVEYPYWENAARLTENHLAIRLVPEGLLMCVPIVSLLLLLLFLNRRRTWGLHSIRDAAENAIDRKYQRDYDARYGRTSLPPEEDWYPEEDTLPYEDEVYDEQVEEACDDSYEDETDYGGYDDYDDYDDTQENVWEEPERYDRPAAPVKSKKERRRERRIKRRRAKRRRQARRRAEKKR